VLPRLETLRAALGLMGPDRGSLIGRPSWRRLASLRRTCVVNADGAGLTNLTDTPGEDAQSAWSADGLQTAFASNRDGNWEIYVMDAEDGRQVNLSNSPSTNDLRPAWRP